MQRSKLSNQPSVISSATDSNPVASLRRTLRSDNDTSHIDSGDDLADPRPWETRASPQLYGSSRDTYPAHYSQSLSSDLGGATGDLPLFDASMETRRRYGEKEVVDGLSNDEKTGLINDDDSGKWAKGYGPGPGVGGRRGLPPRQRIAGWVGPIFMGELTITAGVRG